MRAWCLALGGGELSGKQWLSDGFISSGSASSLGFRSCLLDLVMFAFVSNSWDGRGAADRKVPGRLTLRELAQSWRKSGAKLAQSWGRAGAQNWRKSGAQLAQN